MPGRLPGFALYRITDDTGKYSGLLRARFYGLQRAVVIPDNVIGNMTENGRSFRGYSASFPEIACFQALPNRFGQPDLIFSGDLQRLPTGGFIGCPASTTAIF
jgi:hypothetical protein